MRGQAHMQFRKTKLLLLAVNVVGGIAVLGSYAWGLGNYPALREALWGGVPDSLRPLYTVNMLLATAGWLYTLAVLMRASEEMKVGNRPGHLLFAIIHMLILVPSAFWMPLTLVVIQQGGAFTWTMTRICLSLVGIGSVLQLWALWTLNPGPRTSLGRGLLIAGGGAFCLQTAVLDAIVWPYYFVIP